MLQIEILLYNNNNIFILPNPNNENNDLGFSGVEVLFVLLFPLLLLADDEATSKL